MSRAIVTDQVLCIIGFVRVPTQRCASGLKSGFAGGGVALENFKSVSPQLAVARVRLHGVALSVVSAHAPHEFRTNVKNTFWEFVRAATACALAAGYEVALLCDFSAREGSVCSPFMTKKWRKRTVPCSDIPSRVAIWLRLPGTTWTSSQEPSIALTTSVSLANCTLRWMAPALSRTKCSLREMALTTSVLLRVFGLRKDAMSCEAHTAQSQHGKARRHLSQLIDMTMLHDEPCKAAFRRRLSKHKCSPGISQEKQVDDVQHAIRDSAIRAFGWPRKAPGAP